MAKYVIASDTGVFVLHPTDTYSAVTSIDCNKGNVTFEFPTQETNPTKKLGGYVTDDSIYWSETDLRWNGDEVKNSAITSFNGDVFNITNSNWDYMFAFCPNMTTIDFGENSTAITSMHSVLYKNSGMTSWTNLNFPNVTNTEQAFYGNINLTNFDFNCTPNSENAIKMLGYTSLESADTTPMTNVKRMDYMLMGCYKLKDATLDINKCESLSHTFVGCESLSGLTLLNDNGTVKVLHNIFNSQGDGGYWQLELGSDRNILNSPRVKEFRLNGASLENINGAFGKQNELDHNGNECYCPIEVVDLGVCPNLKTFGASPFSHCYNLREITMKNSDNITSCTSLFADGCNSLTSVTLGTWRNLTDTAINANGMFANCPSLNESGIDLYMPNNMTANKMFSGCTSLTSWDLSAHTPNVTNTENMFVGCVGLTSFDIPTLPQLTKTNNMFSGCTNLTACTIADNPILKEISYMFNGCTNLKSVSIGNCPSVTTMTAPFSGCNNLSDLSYGSMPLLSSATKMFSGFTNLSSITLNFPNVSVVNEMFAKCTNLYNNGCNFTLPKVIKATSMFVGSNINDFAFTQIPNATDITTMFSGCTFESITLPNLPLVATATSLFADCKNLTSATINTLKTTELNAMFKGCDNLVSITAPTTIVKMTSAFSGVNWTSLDGKTFNAIKVSQAPSLFWNCKNLQNANLDTAFPNNTVLTNLGSVFAGCDNLTSFTSSYATSLDGIFSGVNWTNNDNIIMNVNNAKITNMNNMFKGCNNLTSVTLGDFSVASCSNIVSGCPNVTNIEFENIKNISKILFGNQSVEHIKITNGKSLNSVGSVSSANTYSVESYSATPILTSFANSPFINLTSSYKFKVYSASTQTTPTKDINLISAITENTSIKTLEISGSTALTNINGLCYGAKNIEKVVIENCDKINNAFNAFYYSAQTECYKRMNEDGTDYKDASGNVKYITSAVSYMPCTALTSVTLNNLKALKVGDNMFSGCSALQEVTMNNCTALTSYELFKDCTSLTSVTMMGLSTTLQNNIKNANPNIPDSAWHFE